MARVKAPAAGRTGPTVGVPSGGRWGYAAPVFSACLALGVSVALLGATAVEASPVRVVVLPFERGDAATREISDAVELELELVDDVMVGSGVEIAAKAGRGRSFSQKRLRRAMRANGVDIAIRGIYDDDATLRLVLYASDGRPRVQERFALGRAAKVASQAVTLLSVYLNAELTARPPIRLERAVSSALR